MVSSTVETSRPRALAVLRLIANYDYYLLSRVPSVRYAGRDAPVVKRIVVIGLLLVSAKRGGGRRHHF
jgi:hypothetical protein